MKTVELLDAIAEQRSIAMRDIESEQQGKLGQFFTPVEAAVFIADFAQPIEKKRIKILDPGAGSGVLSAALAIKILSDNPEIIIDFTAIEKDAAMIPHLQKTFEYLENFAPGRLTSQVINADFILDSIGLYSKLDIVDSYDLVIQNPPYGKLASSSEYRKAMKFFGVDSPNLYSSFLAIAVSALVPGGQLIAITPRSFFNGPYFSEFRRYFLDSMALQRIHVFESRSSVFSDTGVLQENVVFSAQKGAKPESLYLSTSYDHIENVRLREVTYGQLIQEDDPHRFIRLAIDVEDTEVVEIMMNQPCTLSDIGVQVSTGKVVDFRSREALNEQYERGSYPLLYPGNVKAGEIIWPNNIRKPQGFTPRDEKQERMLMPEGCYTVVKRFSSKEEKKRIVAATWSSAIASGPVAFENHLNVFHQNGVGLSPMLSVGLSIWLNSDVVDRFFRSFSGHTQVNATDLRTLRFPDVATLVSLGQGSISLETLVEGYKGKVRVA